MLHLALLWRLWCYGESVDTVGCGVLYRHESPPQYLTEARRLRLKPGTSLSVKCAGLTPFPGRAGWSVLFPAVASRPGKLYSKQRIASCVDEETFLERRQRDFRNVLKQMIYLYSLPRPFHCHCSCQFVVG